MSFIPIRDIAWSTVHRPAAIARVLPDRPPAAGAVSVEAPKLKISQPSQHDATHQVTPALARDLGRAAGSAARRRAGRRSGVSDDGLERVGSGAARRARPALKRWSRRTSCATRTAPTRCAAALTSPPRVRHSARVADDHRTLPAYLHAVRWRMRHRGPRGSARARATDPRGEVGQPLQRGQGGSGRVGSVQCAVHPTDVVVRKRIADHQQPLFRLPQ